MDEIPNATAVGGSGIVDINTASAVLFVVFASFFLIVLYKLMSYWFIELLVVLFCIGGVEVWVFPFTQILELIHISPIYYIYAYAKK